MLITRECDYAVRILRILAKEGMIAVKEISEREDVPLPYTYKICRKLTKAGFLRSHRGASGGFELRVDPKNISLLDVFESVDKPLQISSCTRDGEICPRNNSSHRCKVHREFVRLQRLLHDEMSSTKLSDII